MNRVHEILLAHGFKQENTKPSIYQSLEKALGEVMVQAKLCPRCGAGMRPGIAIEQTYTGMPDFPGDKCAVTLSPGGPGRVVGSSD